MRRVQPTEKGKAKAKGKDKTKEKEKEKDNEVGCSIPLGKGWKT